MSTFRIERKLGDLPWTAIGEEFPNFADAFATASKIAAGTHLTRQLRIIDTADGCVVASFSC